MKKKRLFLGIAIILIVFTLSVIPTFAWYSTAAVGYNKVPNKFWGFSCAVGVQENTPITTKVVGAYTNNGTKTRNYTKTVSLSKDITFGYSTSTRINSSISLKSGDVSGSLGAEMQKSYNFSQRYNRSETDTMTFKVKPKKTVKIRCKCYGDKVMVYYKYFKFWKSTEMGCATIYIPRWYHFFTN